MKSQIFLYLTHSSSRAVLREFEKIAKAVQPRHEAAFLFHERKGKPIPRLGGHAQYAFTDESIAALGYPMLGPSLVPGNTHLPLLQFALEHPGYSHYWIIENDVRFSGDWADFFSHFERVEKDFLTCNLWGYESEPTWPWWGLSHPSRAIPVEKRLRAFNTIYRLSRAAVEFLNRSLNDGWCGHQEVLISTLLHHHGYSLMDFGGQSDFTPADSTERFYIPDQNRDGLLIPGTMRYRPAFWRTGPLPGKLYHPVKPLRSVILGKKGRRLWKRLIGRAAKMLPWEPLKANFRRSGGRGADRTSTAPPHHI